MTVLDVATMIKDLVDEVRGFESQAETLATRIKTISSIMESLKKILSRITSYQADSDALVEIILENVNDLKNCFEKAREFLGKLSRKSLMQKFLNSKSYSNQFVEFSEDLVEIQDVLKTAIETEVLVLQVLAIGEREQLSKTITESARCFDRARVKEQDELDMKKDTANIMTLLEQLETGK